jgi:signal transduction histidine kinase
MDGLIDDLLTLAKQGQSVGEVEPVALPELANTCWQTIQTGEATLTVEAECVLRADAKRCQQLLENLIRNAIEHGGEAVTITIGELADEDGFYVADDGPGIPADEREMVFDSGYSTADSGVGLGLAIVKEIVQAHGWTVEITQSEHGGTRFEISDVDRLN